MNLSMANTRVPAKCRELGARLPVASLAIGILGAGLLWAYWPTLLTMVDRWEHDPQYSHGFLVPLFALTVLWMRRAQIPELSWEPSWWGLAILAGTSVLRLHTGARDMEVLDSISLLFSLTGAVLLVGGWKVLRWSWPAIGFLGFMLPLPYTIEQSMAIPLRRLATIMSAYLLETLGYPAVTEGNIIWIDQIQLGVVDACSGLGMLMTFFALATALALVIQNNWKDKLVLVISAIPIAVLANVVRITATGVAYVHFGGDAAKMLFHDLAGWLMMPLALGLLWLELRFLEHLFVEVAEPAPLGIPGLGKPVSASAGGRAFDKSKQCFAKLDRK